MREVLGVYRDTITVFNYHAATGRWFPSVISGADLLTTKANSATTAGGNNADAVDNNDHKVRLPLLLHNPPSEQSHLDTGSPRLVWSGNPKFILRNAYNR